MSTPYLRHVTPAMCADLRACPLRLDFALRSSGSGRRRSAFAVLGEIAHTVLSSAVRERAWTGGSTGRLDALWAAAVAAAVVELKAAEDHLGDVDPRRWPEYELRRVRLTHVFDEVASLLRRAGPSAEVLTEYLLADASRKIRGRIDLVVRSNVLHVVVDYKTGHVADSNTAVNPDYLLQMELYGYLEHERSGRWPSEGCLLSFADAPVHVPIDPEHATATALKVLEELEEFNRRAAGDGQPARPSAAICKYCNYAARCGPFWTTCTTDWSSTMTAARGTVSRVVQGQLPLINIEMLAASGSVPAGNLVIRQIPLAEFPNAARVRKGQTLAAVGLQAEPSRATYRLPPQGFLWIEEAGDETSAAEP